MSDLIDSFNKDREKNDSGTSVINHERSGTVRNLSFVLLDGREIFLSYSYLISCEYIPEESVIVLIYTTHEITLKGNHLAALNESLKSHVPQEIRCFDSRYENLKKEDETFINEIVVRKL